MTENERKMIYLDDAINGAISIQRSNGVEIYSDKAVPVEYLINLPSAQPEIIYCKECVCGHCEVWLCGDGSTDVYGYCGRTNFRVLPYDYCSRAGRRENG